MGTALHGLTAELLEAQRQGQLQEYAAQINAETRHRMRPCEYCGQAWGAMAVLNILSGSPIFRPAKKCKCCGAPR